MYQDATTVFTLSYLYAVMLLSVTQSIYECPMIKVLPWCLMEESEKNHEHFSQDSWCPGQDLSQILPECKSEMLLLQPFILSIIIEWKLYNNNFHSVTEKVYSMFLHC
jgi:hypothetical protein